MLMKKKRKDILPDVTSHSSSQINSRIDWVGMDRITLPFQLLGEAPTASADVYVNVTDPSAKGIHMSRLFLALGQSLLKKELTVDLLKKTLQELVDSQKGLSDSALLRLNWKQPMLRKALLSDNNGWKNYPMSLKVSKKQNELSWQLSFSVLYSSTCPCSSALARQLVEEAFREQFSGRNLNFDEVSNWLGQNQIASPHSQRSRADIRLVFAKGKESLDFVKYVNAIEEALRTPVQTAVKREDEQEFARLNGENLMFVEDALRKMKAALEKFPELKKFTVKTHHLESLHAHDAVGVISK